MMTDSRPDSNNRVDRGRVRGGKNGLEDFLPKTVQLRPNEEATTGKVQKMQMDVSCQV